MPTEDRQAAKSFPAEAAFVGQVSNLSRLIENRTYYHDRLKTCPTKNGPFLDCKSEIAVGVYRFRRRHAKISETAPMPRRRIVEGSGTACDKITLSKL
jgi:hypothetical protein